MFRFILFRDGSREVSDMAVAWLKESRSEAELDAYVPDDELQPADDPQVLLFDA